MHYIILGIYFLSLIVVVITSKRAGSKDAFLLANRDLNVLESASTIGASWFGAGVMISYTALAYMYGASALWFFVGNICGFSLFYYFARYLKALADEHKFFTLPDYFFHLFGPTAGKLISIIVIMITTGWLIINFIGGGSAIHTYTGVPTHQSVLIAGLVIWLYSIVGGFRAIVKTDIIQSVTVFILFFILLYMIGNYGRHLTLRDFNLLGVPPFEIASFFIAGALVPLGSAELWQRIYATRSLNVLRSSIIWVCVFFLFIGSILMIIGLIIKSQLPQIEASEALVRGFAELLSPTWSSAGLVVLYAAIMSSADSYLFAATSSIVQDLWHRNTQNQNSRTVRSIQYVLTLTTLIGIVLALWIGDIVAATFLMTSLLLGLGMLVLLIWRSSITSPYPVILAGVGMVVGILSGMLTVGPSIDLIIFSLGGSLVGFALGVSLAVGKNKTTAH